MFILQGFHIFLIKPAGISDIELMRCINNTDTNSGKGIRDDMFWVMFCENLD